MNLTSDKEYPTENTQNLRRHVFVIFCHLDHVVEIVSTTSYHPNYSKVIRDLAAAFLIDYSDKYKHMMDKSNKSGRPANQCK